MKSYLTEDCKLITDSTSPPQPDVSSMIVSNDTCKKVKVIIYCENYFRDEWVGAGNDPIER